MTHKPILSIIILNWNTVDLLRSCLASLVSAITLPHEILVVDNNSTDDSVVMVQTSFPQATLIPLAENVGFARGNNAGLARARGEFLLLLNPDTEVEPGALDALVQFLQANDSAGIAGPSLCNQAGVLEYSARPLPTLWQEFLLQTMLYRLAPHRNARSLSQARPSQVGWVTGAALLIRRACFQEIGPLDANIFMFAEDTDWCTRAGTAGWSVWYVPNARIMHIKSAASSRFARTRTIIQSQQSTVYYYRKHRGEHAVLILRAITVVGAHLRFVRAAVLWLAGRDRADQRARLRAYAALLRWALVGGEPQTEVS